jgi:hypothetical protein
MSDQPTAPPPFDSELPPKLQDALRKMSERGPVVEMSTGATVAEGGRLVSDQPGGELMACVECARAVALGWFGSIARHIGDAGAPVCVLCSEGDATLTAVEWFALTASLVSQRTADGQRRTWRDDAVKGLGAMTVMPCPRCDPEESSQ